MTVTDPTPAPLARPWSFAVPRGTVPGGATGVATWTGVVAVAVAVGWLGVVGTVALAQAGSLSAALATAQVRTVGPALFAMVGVLLTAERLWPAVPRPFLARAHLVDAGYLAVFAVAVVPLLTLVETGFAVEMTRHAAFLIVSRLPLVPQALVVAVILVGIDAMNWVAHVANHRSASLWRLHALHHSQEDMSVLTTFRTHPLVHATYLGALLPALILGASGTVPAAALIAYGCLVALPHANLAWTLGPVGRVMVSPAYHRLHHASAPLDGRGTVNFGFVLVGWDRLAHLAVSPDGQAPVATGIAGRPVPVEQAAPGRGAIRVMLAQLGQPFSAPQPDRRSVVTDLAVRARHATEQIHSTKEAPVARDVALLVVRVALAWIFIYHGAGTLFGAFGQPGIHGHAVFFADVAHLRPGAFFAVLSGVIEFFGGIAVGLGVFGRLAASVLVGDMVMAVITVTWHNGIVSNAAGSGYELNIALAALAMAIVILGTGRMSLDALLRRRFTQDRSRP